MTASRRIAALALVATAAPARAAWWTRFVPSPAPTASTSLASVEDALVRAPNPRCELRLAPGEVLDPVLVEHVAGVLRWTGGLLPLAGQRSSDVSQDIALVCLTNGLTLAPPPEISVAHAWFANVQRFSGHEKATAERDRLTAISDESTPTARVNVVERLMKNLNRLLVAVQSQSSSRTLNWTVLAGGSFSNTVNLGFYETYYLGVIREGRRALAPLRDPRVTDLVEAFLIHALPSLARHHQAMLASAVTPRLADWETPRAELTAARAELESKLNEYVRQLRQHQRPSRPDGPTARYDVGIFTADPERLVNRPPTERAGVDRLFIDAEVHRAGQILNDVLTRSRALAAADVDWAHWARTRSGHDAWIDGFVAAIGRRRDAAFATLRRLDQTRREIEALRAWADRERQAFTDLGVDPAVAVELARVTDAMTEAAAAVERRAGREREALSTIHRFELLVSRHLHERLATNAEVRLPEELARELDALARPSG